MEARVGIEPNAWAVLQTAAFPLGYRALAGVRGIEPLLAVLETAALPLHYAPVFAVFQLSKSKKNARLFGGPLGIRLVMDSTRPHRALDSSPLWCNQTGDGRARQRNAAYLATRASFLV